MTISARNQLTGTVGSIRRGEAIAVIKASDVMLATG